MASFTKRGKTWRAEVKKQVDGEIDLYATETFPTKQEGVIWAAAIESEWYSRKRGNVPNKPFNELLERYAKEKSVKKAGEKWERLRLALIGRDEIGNVPLPSLNSTHFVARKDRRLKTVSGASVRREMNLLNHRVEQEILGGDEHQVLVTAPA